MYIHQCPECGRQYTTAEKVNRVKCPHCGHETTVAYAEENKSTAQEQWQQFGSQAASAIDNVFTNGPTGKCRGVAGLLALLLGAFGLHYFYLNKPTAGVIFLLITILSCFILGTVTEIIALIQGVLFFTMTEEEFEQKWIYNPSGFPLF